MDMQALVEMVNTVSKLESAKEYSLGKLIKDLEKVDKDLIVEIDNGDFPNIFQLGYADDSDSINEYGSFNYDKNTDSVFRSWRGSYCELAMEYSSTNQGLTAESLLKMANFIIGKYLEGYKGGDFLMDKQTPIHIDNYSESRNVKLVGTEIKDNKLILRTRQEDEDV